MSKRTHLQASDLHGLRRLAVDATEGLTDLVEAMHQRILHPESADELPLPTILKRVRARIGARHVG